MKLPRISLAALVRAQPQPTFNAYAANFMLIALAPQLARHAGRDPIPMVSFIPALLVLPYIVFEPVGG